MESKNEKPLEERKKKQTEEQAKPMQVEEKAKPVPKPEPAASPVMISGFPGRKYVPVSYEEVVEAEEERPAKTEQKIEWESKDLPASRLRKPEEVMEHIKQEGGPDWPARIITLIGVLLIIALGYFAVAEKWYKDPDRKFKDFTGRIQRAYALLLKKPTGYKMVTHTKKVKEYYYTCPDDPQVVQDEPGECPIDGRKLVRKQRWVEKEVTEKTPVYDYGGTGSLGGDPHEHGDPEKTKEEKGYYYTCSMHPQIIEDEPGNCPICGMKLTRKEKKKSGGGSMKKSDKTAKTGDMPEMDKGKSKAESPEGEHKDDKMDDTGDGMEQNLITVTTRMRQVLGMVSERVKVTPLVKRINTVGNIEYNEKSLKTATARVAGRLDKLYVDFTGVRVRKGRPLASIYSPQLVSTQKEYLLALETMKKLNGSKIDLVRNNAASLAKAAERRLRLWDLTEKQIRIIRETGRIHDHLTIYSPVSGTVIKLMTTQGEYVKEGAPLYTIADLSTVWIQAEIYEDDTEWVYKGQPVEITLDAYPGRKFHGYISFIDPFVNRKTKTSQVRIEIRNYSGMLKPGMYARAVIKSRISSAALTIPRSAVIRSGKRDIVFIDRGEGKILPREVTLGHEVEGRYQVKKGLKKGQKVITSATFLLDSESNLQETIRRMMQQAEMSGGDGKPAMPGHQH